MEPRIPTRAVDRIQVSRNKFSFASAAPPPSFVRKTSTKPRQRDETPQLYDTHVPARLRKTTVQQMLNKDGKLPAYDPLSDPHLSDYFARKYGWTAAVEPPRKRPMPHGSGPASATSMRRGYTASRTRHGRSRGGSRGRRAGSGAEGTGGTTSYTVQLYTSSESNRASKSMKHLRLIGTKGKSETVELAGPGVHFKAGTKDTFQITCPSLGQLKKVVLENFCERKRDAWHVSRVTVKRAGKKPKTWTFPAKCWLSAFHGDKKTKRVLHANAADGKGSTSTYEVEVYTGDKFGAGTDAHVYVTLIGDKGSSPRTELRSKGDPFERAKTDRFTLDTPKLGKLRTCRIEHDNSGISPGWLLDRVVVTHVRTGGRYVFRCNEWLSRKHGLLRDLAVETAEEERAGMTDYIVHTFTGNRRGAGTDADVSVILFGKDGQTGPHRLDNSRNNFERGREDRFTINAPNVGTLERIRIFHDNSGIGPGWFLDSVRILNSITSEEFEFPCSRWLARDEDDGEISRELLPTALSSFSTVPYKLLVRTGDKRLAGTSANVFCKLTGKKGDTGRVPLSNDKRNFTRGRADTFTVDAEELGTLTHIEIGHDNTGVGPGWFVDELVVENPVQGKRYIVPINEWFSMDEADGRLVRQYRLTKDITTRIRKKGLWLCQVQTSDVRFAGTNANVYIQVYGSEGHSDVIPLRNKSDNFERNKMDEFKLELTDMGVLQKLRVWHDNKGMGSAWHLDHIILRDIESGSEYTFKCGRWLARDEEDGEIVRELVATGDLVNDPPIVVDYEVHVYTGHKMGAGTDANVYLTVFGTNGDTGKRQLRKSATHRNKFERGKEDVFTINAVELGDLTHIVIGHDNAGGGAAWFLEKVDILDPSRGDTLTFPCHRWLAKNEDDGHIERTLPVLGSDGMVDSTTTYVVRVRTGDVRGAGTDAGVYMTLFGDNGDSGQLTLRKSETYRNPFERGHVDVFRFELGDLGQLKRCVVGHNNRGAGSAWFLDDIVVEVPSSGRVYTFPCSRWLSKRDDDGLTERELYVDANKTQEHEEHASLLVRVRTSDVFGAGTDAKVFISIYGDQGKTEEMLLSNKSDNFERNQVDEFKLTCPDVGKIEKIRLGHDNRGLGSDWHVHSVELHDLKNDRIYTCAIDQWLKKTKGSKRVVLEAPVTKVEALEEGEREVLEESTREQHLKPYSIAVHTGDVFGAGTDANVYMTLHGEKGDTGERHLNHSSTHRNKFERKNVDVFEVPAVNLGSLKRLRIWHDNKGGGAAWYLHKVVVTDPEDSKEYTFMCDQWLSKTQGDKQTSRELGVQEDVPEDLRTKAVTTTFDVAVHTADVRYAGTDANVYICLYGEKGDTGKIPLTKSLTNRNKWERGRVDKFKLEAVDIGELQKILIGHDGKGAGAGWMLDKVVIDCALLGRTWVFKCGEWLDKSTGDGTLERVLTPSEEDTAEYEAKVPYEVVVRTSDIKGAGTDAHVFMDVYGRLKESGEDKSTHYDFPTEKRLFERGTEDRFNVELDDVGEPFKLRIGHDNRGMFSRWHLDSVTLINQNTKEAFEFPSGAWFGKGGDDKLVRELAVAEVKGLSRQGTLKRKGSTVSLREVEYAIHVFTGDVSGGGTDAGVFIIVYGENGDTGEIKLAKSETHRDKFERNHEDVFRHSCVDLGALKRIKIWHDNKGIFKSASWHLDRVEITDDTGHTTKFVCDDWLSRKHGDKETRREIEAWVDPSVAQAEAEKLKQRATQLERKASSASTRSGPSAVQSRKQKKELKELKESADAAREEARNAAAKAQRMLSGSGGTELDYVITITTAERKRPKKSTNKNRGSSDEEDEETLMPENVFVEVHGEKSSSRHAQPHRTSSSTASASPKNNRRSRSASSSSAASAPPSPLSTETMATSTGRLPLPASSAAFAPGTSKTVTLRGVDVGRITSLRIGYDVPADNDEEEEEEEKEHKRKSEDDSGVNRGDSGKRGSARRGGSAKSRSASGATSSFVWRVASVEVKVPSKGERALFERSKENKWKRRKSETRGRLMVLPITSLEELNKQVEYELLVTTGDKMGAGTSADTIQFNVCGEKGVTDPLKPDASHSFERNSTVHLRFTARDVGLVTCLRVKHRNKGIGGAWFLDRVVLRCPAKDLEATFVWDSWLKAKNEEHDILPLQGESEDDNDNSARGGRAGAVDDNDADDDDTASVSSDARLGRSSGTMKVKKSKYKLYVKTGSVWGAGTDANVSCVLFGVLGESRTIKLGKSSTHRDKFERGHTDIFEEELPSLGQLTRLRIWHDSARFYPSWFLEEVTVVEEESQSSYVFPCFKWLSKSKADKQVVRELVCADADYRARTGTYKVTVHTADAEGADTTAQVMATLIGENDRRHALVLPSDPQQHFQRGGVDEFVFEDIPLVGSVRGCILELFPPEGKRKVSPWTVDKVEVAELQSGETVTLYNTQKRKKIEEVATFKTEEAMSSAELQRSAQTINYEIHVYTGDVRGAGTDANVFMTLHGENGNTGERGLTKSKTYTNKFERKHEDVFEMEAIDLGTLTKLSIRHDNWGLGGDWFLDRIEVLNPIAKTKTTFPCNEWLSKKRGLSKELTPQ